MTTATGTRTPQNNSFNAKKQSLCRAFHILVHFLANPAQIQGFLGNKRTPRSIFHSLSPLECHSYQFSSWIVWSLYTGGASLKNREIPQIIELIFSSDIFVTIVSRGRCLSYPFI